MVSYLAPLGNVMTVVDSVPVLPATCKVAALRPVGRLAVGTTLVAVAPPVALALR